MCSVGSESLSRVHRPASVHASQCYPGVGNLPPSTDTDTRMLTCRCTSCPGLSNTPAVPPTRFLKCDRLQPHLEPPPTPPWMAMQAADAPCQIARGSITHLPAPAAGSPPVDHHVPSSPLQHFNIACACRTYRIFGHRAFVGDILIRDHLGGDHMLACSLTTSCSSFSCPT